MAEVATWYDALVDEDWDSAQQVEDAIDVLAAVGPTLGRPLVDRIKGAEQHHMKELRPGSSGSGEIRILFAFDPIRRAVLLVAGDKAGDWQGWYNAHPAGREALSKPSRRTRLQGVRMSSVSWEETKRAARERRIAAGLPVRTAEEKQAAMDRLAAEVRAYQLAEVRRDQALTQRDVAGVMGVSAPRVSAIEHGEVDRTEVATLRSYVEALGGRLRVVADFGDTEYTVA